jgi:hypothetical protein
MTRLFGRLPLKRWKQAVPTAEVRYFDSSHFALDENADAIAEAIIKTFSR